MAVSSSAARYEPDAAAGRGRPAGRFWSVRRAPAALVALVLLLCAAVLLYDIASVRAERRSAPGAAGSPRNCPPAPWTTRG